MSDTDAKIICKSIDINNIISIKLIVYGLLKKGFLHQYRHYMINNFVQCGIIDNKTDRIRGL